MLVKIKVMKEVEFNAKTLKVRAGVRYWEDSTINGIEDAGGNLTPCRDGEDWCPIIDIDSGVILNWESGKVGNIHFKVCDDGRYDVFDDKEEMQLSIEGYVPRTMCPKENGCGDYIIMDIDENGKINGWKFDIANFLPEEHD